MYQKEQTKGPLFCCPPKVGFPVAVTASSKQQQRAKVCVCVCVFVCVGGVCGVCLLPTNAAVQRQFIIRDASEAEKARRTRAKNPKLFKKLPRILAQVILAQGNFALGKRMLVK